MDNCPIVGSALTPHSNQTSSSSKNAELVSGYDKKKSSLTLYLPDNIDIDRLLSEKPPGFKYFRDCFVYILHLITAIPARKRDEFEKGNGFTPLNRQLLQKRIHDYKQYLDYLIENYILIEDGYYIPGEKSKGLQFVNPSRKLIPIQITKWTLIKSISQNYKSFDEEKTKNLDYLRKWFNFNLKVDFIGCMSFLETKMDEDKLEGVTPERINFRFLCRQLPVLKLKNNSFDFYVDSTGFRLHTAFTQMMSGLRKFVKYNSETLCAVDMKNSQLYLMIALLDDKIFVKNNFISYIPNPHLTSTPQTPIMLVYFIKERKNKSDVIKFKNWVTSGLFYENFGELLIKNGILEADSTDIRNKIKDIVFSTLYSPINNSHFNKSIKIFKDNFPTVYAILSKIKTGNNYKALSIALQRFEADLVLNKACKKLSQKYPYIPLFTVHDSIVTTEKYVKVVKSELYNVLRENVGFAPGLKIERWE